MTSSTKEAEELANHLLGAVSYAEVSISELTPGTIYAKQAGDIVTLWDKEVHNSIGEYFYKNNIRVRLIGEEGRYSADNPEVDILLDEIEGTQNAVNALPYGINIAACRHKGELRPSDLAASVVLNLRDGRRFVATKEGGTRIINNGQKKAQTKQSDIWEVPLGYMTTEEQEHRQDDVRKSLRNIFGPQYRSIDATGTRLAEIADGNLRLYADWRDATKPWDVLPSWLILKERGLECTDILGFSFDDAVLVRDNKLNMRIGENFLAANSEDHRKALEKIVWLYLTKTAIEDIYRGTSSIGKIKMGVSPEASIISKRLILDPIGYGFDLIKQLAKKEPATVGMYFADMFNKKVDERAKAYGRIMPDDIYSLRRATESYIASLSSERKMMTVFGKNLKF